MGRCVFEFFFLFFHFLSSSIVGRGEVREGTERKGVGCLFAFLLVFYWLWVRMFVEHGCVMYVD